MMYEYFLTVGLFDKDTERQEIATETAEAIISNTLIDDFGVFAFTMINCKGVYKMCSTGDIVREPSIRVEIATDEAFEKETVLEIIGALKVALNQESIMYKVVKSEIEFI